METRLSVVGSKCKEERSLHEALLAHLILDKQNGNFSGSGRVSDENRPTDFQPAFRDAYTGRIYLSRFADGRAAPVHMGSDCRKTWHRNSTVLRE